MPVITKRGKSFQAMVAYKGVRHRRQFATEAEALAWGHETRSRVLRGEQPETGDQANRKPGKPYTLGELRDWTMEVRWAKIRAVKSAEINARHVVEIIGASKPIHKIDSHEVGKLKIGLEKAGNAPATVNRKMAALSAMLTEAYRLEIIDRKPHIPRSKETERRRFRFTVEIEARALRYFERIGQPDMADFVAVSLDTGMRQHEVLHMQVQDVADGAVTAYETKGGLNRVIPLTVRTKAILARRSEGKHSSDLLFDGFHKWAVRDQWLKLREVMELVDEPSFVPHILRHEFCSRLAQRGVNASTIMRLSGHATLSLVQRYVNLTGVSLVDTVALLEPVAA